MKFSAVQRSSTDRLRRTKAGNKSFILLTLLMSCTGVSRQAEFSAFLKTIPPTPLPSVFHDHTPRVPPYKYDDTFKRFKTSSTYRTLTRFSSHDGQITVLVDVDTGSVKVPFLVSYNNAGERIDSLMFTQGPVDEDTFSIRSELVVNVERSIVRWTIRSWEPDSITGTQQHEETKTDSLVYNLSKDGRFTLE